MPSSVPVYHPAVEVVVHSYTHLRSVVFVVAS